MNVPNEYYRYIRPITIVCKIIAIWPLEKKTGDSQSSFHLAKLSRVIHRIILFVSVTVCTIAAAVDIFKNLSDMAEATECALVTSSCLICCLRIAIFTIHQKNLTILINIMKIDWLTSSNEDRNLLNEKCSFTFHLAHRFIITVFITIGFFMTVPPFEIIFLGSEDRVLPFRGYYFKNQTTHYLFPYIYAFNILSGAFLGGSAIAAATTLNLILVMHAAAKFSLVRKCLETLDQKQKNFLAISIDCIKKHQEAIDFANRLEDTINILAFGQFLVSSGIVCIAGFQIVAMKEDRGRLMKYISFLLSATFGLFLFSYSGDVLITESEDVGNSCFNSDWVGANDKYKRNIKILMIRSTKPCKITAGKFYDMSLQSFSNLLSTSFSYFTVLSNYN
ncbi:hypothetical protein HCN44_002680 [Aphidius gifuensis]|uniref:Odorant receptor n=1 Tax=Aphidius gifuensis TaxID=684658 RepID=A0A3Q9EJT2_APHGI|nr:odorant receptor 13a-like [Aphidius gifuensis]AZQ24930.1 odorant receptor [Aphidius gifuensis]KAF7991118.1 hypothetical protein HCN44_002680 [Aphidius gifuensis]